VINWIVDIINTMGYPGIAALMFLENVFPPIPSEVIMSFAGFSSAQGNLSFTGILLAGTLGSVASSLPLYYAGRFIGEERLKSLADRYGKWVMVSSRDVERSIAWFEKHGNKAVFFGRLVPGVRSLISVPAGIARMNLVTFLFYSFLGTALWTALLAYIGRVLGENYAQIEHYLDPLTYGALGALAIIAVLWVWKRRKSLVRSTAVF
jgi:membrane protein DedA with SNARE-associated domain